jgi:PhnB protein
MKKVERKSQKRSTSAVPKGFRTVTPYLVVNDARGLLEFIEKAFDGEVTSNMKGEDGRIMHATIQIGDSVIMVSDVMKGMNEPMPTMLYLYVDDVDATYRQALDARATSIREPVDEFYGDRAAGVKDKWNNQWWLATHIEDMSSDEMERRKEEFLKHSEHVSHA